MISLQVTIQLAAAVIGLVLGTALWVVRRVPRLTLRGKTVFITGGSTGIGLEMAKEFVRRGAYVCIAARRRDVLESAEGSIRASCGSDGAGSLAYPRVTSVVMDVASDAAVTAAMDGVQVWLKDVATAVQPPTPTASKPSRSSESALATTPSRLSVDVLVCSAGFAHPTRFLDVPPAIGRQMMDVNYFGCVNAVRAFLPAMYEAKRGRVVLLSSQAAVAAVAGFTLYSPTKAAVRAFACALNMESAARGVQVQLVNPPDVATPGYDEENKVKSPECKEICAMSSPTPWKAADVARAAVDGIQTYQFQVNIGMDGWLLGCLSAGFDPASGVGQLLCEATLAGVLRLVIGVYSKIYYGVVAKHLRKELATAKKEKR